MPGAIQGPTIPKLPPPNSKRCEVKGCLDSAMGFVIFEAKGKPIASNGVAMVERESATTILPFEWRCLKHAAISHEMVKEPLKSHIASAFKNRLGYVPSLVQAGLSTLNEDEVLELKYFSGVAITEAEKQYIGLDIAIEHVPSEAFKDYQNPRKKKS